MTEICQFGRRNADLFNVLSGSFVSCCLFYRELRCNIVINFILAAVYIAGNCYNSLRNVMVSCNPMWAGPEMA